MLVIYLCVRDIDIVSFYDFDICFLNYSDSVVFCVLFLLMILLVTGKND